MAKRPLNASFSKTPDKDNIKIIKTAKGITYDIHTALSPMVIFVQTCTSSPTLWVA